MEDQNGSYTLDQYYRVLAEFGLPDGTTVYLRSLSDDEMSLSRKASVIASRNRRRELRDESSDAFSDYVEPIEHAHDEDLVAAIVDMSRARFQQEAQEQFVRRHNPYPDDATLEEQHDVDDKREEHWKEILEERSEYLEKRSEAFKEKVQNWTREEKVAECRELSINSHALEAYLEEHNNMLVLLGCFKDKKRKKRYFSGVDEVRQLNPNVKMPLRDKLNEITNVDVFKLQELFSTAS